MSITDELREWAHEHLYKSGIRSDLLAIADSIDAEHQKVIRELNNLADSSVLLPVDADGVPVRLGDKVYQGKGGWVYTVKSISFYPDNTTVTFDCKHGFGSDSAHNLRHYHAPTVEDVLREMVAAYMNTPLDDSNDDEFFAEYVDKLRLAGSDDE